MPQPEETLDQDILDCQRELAESVARTMREVAAGRRRIARTYLQFADQRSDPDAEYFRGRARHLEALAARAERLYEAELLQVARATRAPGA